MAIKADREIYITDIGFISTSAAVAGQVAVYKSSQDTGHAVGQGINGAEPQCVPVGTGSPASGTKLAGVYLTDVIDIYQYALLADGAGASGLAQGIGDPILQRLHRNLQKTEQVVGENAYLLKDGVIWTNRITGTPAAGDDAYVGANSNLQNTQVNAIAQVGKFNTAKDSDGYAKVTIKIV